MSQFSLRTYLVLISCALLVVASLLPAIQETRLINELRAQGAEITSASALPDIASSVAGERLHHATELNLQTPQETVALLRSRVPMPKLRSAKVVGIEVDFKTAKSLASLPNLESLELDSTRVTARQVMLIRQQHPNLKVIRTFRWLNKRIELSGKWPYGLSENPVNIIPVVNHLRRLRKPQAIEALEAYCNPLQPDKEFNLRYLMPLVFERDEEATTPCACVPQYAIQARNVEDMFELLDLLEHPDTEAGLNDAVLDEVLHTRVVNDRKPALTRYDLRIDYMNTHEYLFLVGDIPFNISGYNFGGYSLSGPLSSAYLLECAKSHGRLIKEPLHPVDNPVRLRARLLKEFRARTQPDAKRDAAASQQISRAIENLDGHIKGASTWSERTQSYIAK